MKKELSPPFKITNDILNLVYEIGELVGKISAEKEFEKNLTLRRKNRITTGRLYHDYQPCNIRDCKVIIGALSSKFNVSQEAVVVRLKRANLYIEGDNCTPLYEHVKRNSWW